MLTVVPVIPVVPVVPVLPLIPLVLVQEQEQEKEIILICLGGGLGPEWPPSVGQFCRGRCCRRREAWAREGCRVTGGTSLAKALC